MDGIPGEFPGVLQFDGVLTSKGKFVKLECRTGKAAMEKTRITAALESRLEFSNANSLASVARNLDLAEGGENQDDANTNDEGEGTGTNDETECLGDDDGSIASFDDDVSIVSVNAGEIKGNGKNKKPAKTESHAWLLLVAVTGRITQLGISV
jgi:hypothetical protein